MSSSSLNAEWGRGGSRCLISNRRLIACSSCGMTLACTPIFCSPSESLVVKNGCASGVLHHSINLKHRKPNNNSFCAPSYSQRDIERLFWFCTVSAFRFEELTRPEATGSCLLLEMPAFLRLVWWKPIPSCSLADDDGGRQKQSQESEKLLENDSHRYSLLHWSSASPGLRLRL